MVNKTGSGIVPIFRIRICTNWDGVEKPILLRFRDAKGVLYENLSPLEIPPNRKTGSSEMRCEMAHANVIAGRDLCGVYFVLHKGLSQPPLPPGITKDWASPPNIQ